MTATLQRASLYVQFEGMRGDRRPVSAQQRAPRTGIKVRIQVEQSAVDAERVYLLYRRGNGDLVLGASGQKSALEQMLLKLGPAARQYEISAIPVLQMESAQLASAS